MKVVLIASISLMVMACTKSAPPPEPPRQTVFDPMVQQLDRARQAANELPRQHRADIDRTIDQSGQ